MGLLPTVGVADPHCGMKAAPPVAGDTQLASSQWALMLQSLHFTAQRQTALGCHLQLPLLPGRHSCSDRFRCCFLNSVTVKVSSLSLS